MKKSPLVSAIVTTFNNEDTLDACLRSILAQDYSPFELIVVDNHSKDKTRKIAKKYTDKLFTQSPERSAQRNRAVKESSGEIVIILDSDMILTNSVISEVVSALDSKDVVGVIIPEESIGSGFWARHRHGRSPPRHRLRPVTEGSFWAA